MGAVTSWASPPKPPVEGSRLFLGFWALTPSTFRLPSTDPPGLQRKDAGWAEGTQQDGIGRVLCRKQPEIESSPGSGCAPACPDIPTPTRGLRQQGEGKVQAGYWWESLPHLLDREDLDRVPLWLPIITPKDGIYSSMVFLTYLSPH